MAVNRYCVLALAICLWIVPVDQASSQPERLCNATLQLQRATDNLYVGNITWSPDGQYLAAIYIERNEAGRTLEQGLHILDSNTLGLVAEIERDMNTTVLDFIVWSPDANHLAAASRVGGDVEVWETGSWSRQLLQNTDTNQFTRQVVWSSDGSQLGVVSHNRYNPETRFRIGEQARIWDVEENTIQTIFDTTLAQVSVAQFDGQWFAAARSENDRTLKIVRLADETVILKVEDSYLVDFGATPEQMLLASVQLNPEDSRNNLLQVWDMNTGQSLFEIAGEASVAFSELSVEAGLLIVRTGSLTWEAHGLINSALLSFERQGLVTPSPNGQLVASVEIGRGGSATNTSTGDVIINDVLSGEIVAAFSGDTASLVRLTWSPDSENVAITGVSGILSLWSVENCMS